jgi:GAF domain-containing protein
MLKENELIGLFTLYRQEVRPFTDKQIALVTNFAAQAVIAIENARLLNELRQRTADLTERTVDLTEALEQRTATSEVLQVISNFPGGLDPVFQAMLEKAVRICNAKFGSILRWENEAAHLVATHNAPPAFAEARRRSQNPANPKTSFGRMIATKAVVYVADATVEPGYAEEHDQAAVAAVELGGQRTALYVPMLKETELVGALTLSRQEVRPFTDKQIELVKTSLLKPSSQLRTRGCSTSCGSRWSSRQPRRRYCRLSRVPPASLSQCLPPCWRRRLASATQGLEISIVWKARACVTSLRTTHLLPLSRR